MESEYPKTTRLRDKSEVVLRPLEKDDFDAMLTFLRSLPEEDRLFLRSDATRIDELKRLFQDLSPDHIFGMVALVRGRIVGDATMHRPHSGWSRHVADVGCVVAPDFRGLGLGTLLLREIVDHALTSAVDKLEVRMMANQVSALRAFHNLGFRREAVLRDHAKDARGQKHNLVIMTNDVAELWQKMQDMIEETDFRGQ